MEEATTSQNAKEPMERSPLILRIKGKTAKALTAARKSTSASRMPDENRISVLNAVRKIAVQADMFVLDHETFTNETTRRQASSSAFLWTQGVSQSVMYFVVRMGGEIRVEFRVNAVIIDAYGNAIADCDVKLFEGDSESTSDLDGHRHVQLYVPAGHTVSHYIRVDNDDEGGDYATISLFITNTAA